MKKEWKYSNKEFAADKYNDTLLKYSPWSGHRNFGYDLINYYEPEVLVELGSFYGCSAFAFMQSMKENNLNTTFYPVDLWEAMDTYTIHDYEQDVYGFFSNIKKSEFDSLKVNMLKMTFEDALEKIEDKSIDILHIDGSHAYDDVKHDFETWKCKLKDNAIVMFHDISDQLLYGETLGSCRYWKELKEEYNYTTEIRYSWGLGILFFSKEMYEDFTKKVDLDYYEKLNEYEATDFKDKIRKDYFKLLDNAKWIESLQKDKEVLENDNKKLLNELEELKEAYQKEINNIVNAYETETKNIKSAYETEVKNIKSAYEATIQGKEQYIEELERRSKK